MDRINFYQNNYIGECDDGRKIKICPVCNTVFEVSDDNCPKCHLYLPSFPTSWVRSATNIFLLRKVLEFIHLDLNDSCNVDNLTDILVDNYIISVNLTRRTDARYWQGGPRRRSYEYLSNLQYLGFIIKNDRIFSLTENGKKLVLAKDYGEYISILADAFMAFKVGNEFDTDGFYSAYNNHILFQCLRIINDLKLKGINATIEHLALAVMCKDELGEYAKALQVCENYDYKKIQKLWFGKGKEFSRVIRGVFVRWLNQVKLIDIREENGTISVKLTTFGENIYLAYARKYLMPLTGAGAIESIEKIIEKSIDKQYLRLSISAESNNRTGAVWETIVKNHLNKLNLEVLWYKESLDFVNIALPQEVMASLTGGTKYNPDLILHNPLWLIDPKKDVNAEMHKVIAYDKYAIAVNGLAIIVTQKIMRGDKINMMEELSLKKVLVLDGYALQVLADNVDYFSKDKIISIVQEMNTKNVYYITEELIFNEFVG